MTPRGLGLAALLAGGACIALSPIFVRLSDTSPAASAFWRVALAIPALWIWARLTPAKSAPSNDLWKPLVLGGISFAGDLALWHWSIAYTSVANATLEANFAPIFVALGAWWLFAQRVSRAFVVALAITLIGAVILVGPNFADRRALFGDALGVGTAIYYAGYLLSVKTLIDRVSVARIAFICTAITAVILLPFAWFTAERFWPQSAYGWGVLIALALISHSAGQSLIAYGLGTVSAAVGSVTLLIQSVLAAVFAWIILSEPLGPVQMLGGAIVLLGIYLARRAG